MRDCNMCQGPGFDPTEQTGPVYLGGVLGIDVNGVRQPIDAEGIVHLAASTQEAVDAAERADQSAEDAAGSATEAASSATDAAGSATAAAASAAAAQTAAERDVPAAAAAWLAEHVDPETGYVIDNSLTIQGAAADAKAAGDRLESVESSLGYKVVSLPDIATINGLAVGGNNAVLTGTSYACKEFAPQPGMDRLIVTSQPARNAYVTFLTASINSASGSVASILASGESGRRQIPSGGITQTIPIPADCTVINITTKASNNITPALVAEQSSETGLAAAEEDARRKQSQGQASERYSAASMGHLRMIEHLDVEPMEILYAYGAVRKIVDGSAYVSVNQGDLVGVHIGYNGIVAYKDAEFYLYFYDEQKQPLWTVLDHSAADGERNRFTTLELKGINGLQTEIPAGVAYVRFAKANNCVASLSVWDGVRFGVPLCAYSTSYDSDGNKVQLPADGSSCIALPQYGAWLMAKPGYTFLRGYASVNNGSIAIPDNFFPAQIIRLQGINGSDRAKNVVVVKGYDYTTGTWDKDVLAGDVSDYAVLVDATDTYAWQKPAARAQRVNLQSAKALTTGWTWTPQADLISSSGSTFKAGCTYHGVPYRSAWGTACYVGWHVTKHTFMAAAADPDSIFYHGHTGGPYYSLVCSSFAELLTGFPYPETNFGLMKDPNIWRHKTYQPPIGDLVTNGYGHCVVPLEIATAGENEHYAVKIVESGSPLAKAKVLYNNVATTWGGIGSDSTYLDHYNVACTPAHHESVASIPYDVELQTLKPTATAKPYRGDQSVYTSEHDVLINIKDSNATRLYYQEFSVECSRGVPGTFTAVGSPAYIDFAAGTTQVTLRSKTTNGTHTGAELRDGAVYGVWASNGAATPTAPTVIEYFEWHDVSTNGISYEIVDGTLVTEDEFWYAICMAYNRVDPYHQDYDHGLISIPYAPPHHGMDPNDQTLYAGNYQKYRENAFIASARPVWAFFRKGKFGAYAVTEHQEESDD